MTERLEQCPSCGGDMWNEEFHGAYWAECEDCNMRGPVTNKQQYSRDLFNKLCQEVKRGKEIKNV